jgi:hypothetical protein
MDKLLGLLLYGGQPLFLGPWFLGLLQHCDQYLHMGPWFMVVHPHYKHLRETLFEDWSVGILPGDLMWGELKAH